MMNIIKKMMKKMKNVISCLTWLAWSSMNIVHMHNKIRKDIRLTFLKIAFFSHEISLHDSSMEFKLHNEFVYNIFKISSLMLKSP